MPDYQDPIKQWIEYCKAEQPKAEARYEQREAERAQAKIDRAKQLHAQRQRKYLKRKRILPIKPSRDYD